MHSVELSDSSSSDEDALLTATPLSAAKFCLYEELAYHIKSLLWSRRKGDPVCKALYNSLYNEFLYHIL